MPGERLPLSGHFVYICSRIKERMVLMVRLFGCFLLGFDWLFGPGRSGTDAYQWKGGPPF